MMAKLMTLPNEPRGSAWPSSARTVRRAVKSVNERDPYLYLLSFSLEREHYRGTADDESEEGAGDDRSVCSKSPGLHVDYNGINKELRLREEELISKLCLSSDRALKLRLVKVKSLVIALDHRAVNMSLLLAHTARQTNRVDLGRGIFSGKCQVLGPQGGLSRNKVAVGESAAGSPPNLY